jgi:lipoate-protein ligase A
MRSLRVHCERLAEPARVYGLTTRALREAQARSHGILCTYGIPGDAISLGRYHVVPDGADARGIGLVRRAGGGRAAPLGDGFAGVVLALPDRASLLAPGTTLVPEQILNRYVRGLLGALESLGLRAYYPGRDVVTVDGRIVASLGFELASDGTTLVEMSLAVGRSFACVSTFADRADPSGVVPMELLLPEQGTCIADVVGRAPDLDDVTAALATGFASRLGCDVAVGDPLGSIPTDTSWLDAGRLARHLDRHAAVRDMLGLIEVYAARAGDRVHDVRVCGDLLAPSAAVERVEARLRGAPIDRDVLRRRVTEALVAPDDVLLGVRDPASVGDLVFEACRS